MKLLMYMSVITLVFVFVLPRLQTYMRMLVDEAEDMKKLYNS